MIYPHIYPLLALANANSSDFVNKYELDSHVGNRTRVLVILMSVCDSTDYKDKFRNLLSSPPGTYGEGLCLAFNRSC